MPVSFRPSAIFAWPEFFVDVKFKLLKKINFCLENDFLSSKVIVVEKIWFFYLKNNFWLEIEFLSLVMNFQAKSRFIFHKPIFDFGIHFDSKFDFWPEFFVDWPKISSSLVGSSIHRGLNSLSALTRSIASFERVFLSCPILILNFFNFRLMFWRLYLIKCQTLYWTSQRWFASIIRIPSDPSSSLLIKIKKKKILKKIIKQLL